ncbi:MAG: uracil-DNA glycosylase [Treponema sp.]|jgi:DNA polymerase|nr:uracil-DNA glycosylase [Treponema sp.]
MTAEQKNTLNGFLNIAEDYLCGGYRTPRAVHLYTDDPGPAGKTSLLENAEERPPPNQAEEGVFSALEAEIKACGACPLSRNRRQALSGTGSEKPLVLVIAECPAPEDDREGQVFTGETGALFDRMLRAIGLYREKNCFITYSVKCSPPPDYVIQEAERSSCAAFLKRQLLCLKPHAILALGAAAGMGALKGLSVSPESAGAPREAGRIGEDLINRTEDMRGRFFSCLGIPLMVTYHPAEVLLNTGLKAPVWKDLQQLQAKLAELEKMLLENSEGGQ